MLAIFGPRLSDMEIADVLRRWPTMLLLVTTSLFLYSDWHSAREINQLTPSRPPMASRAWCDILVPILFGICIFAIAGPSVWLPWLFFGIYLLGFGWSAIILLGSTNDSATLRSIRYLVVHAIAVGIYAPTAYVAITKYATHDRLSDGMLICVAAQFYFVELIDFVLPKLPRPWLRVGGRALVRLLDGVTTPFVRLKALLDKNFGSNGDGKGGV